VPVLLSLAGHTLGRGLPPPSSYRLGACFLMALTSGLVFGTLARTSGLAAGLVGAAGLLLNPPLFAHAHIAATDTPVSCFFLLAIALWLECAERPRLVWAVGLICGLGLASKASFALFPVLLLVWLLFFGDAAAWRRGLVLALVAPLVMLAVCPMWWAHPIAAPVAFLSRVLHAGERWQIDAFYLGHASTERLPWHSGLVLTAVTTPPLTLLLALFGGVSGVARKDRAAVFWVFGAAALPLARLLPNAPGHDGARLLMPSLYCLAPLAAMGFARLVRRVAVRRLAPLGLLGMVTLGTWSVVSMHPYEMSYYSECVGGLRGAARLGFEVTYWFDAFTPEAREDVQARLPRGARVWTAPRYTGYPLLRAWGFWRGDIVDDEERPEYLILYSRYGYLSQVPRLAQIAREESPLWSLRSEGVPLIRLYRIESGATQALGDLRGRGKTSALDFEHVLRTRGNEPGRNVSSID
jgi:4-amino-4-deoxy-L-arabinose transferase-like glycosyltransferase